MTKWQTYTEVWTYIKTSKNRMMPFLALCSLILLCTLPAFQLSWQLLHNTLGANPVESLIHTTGDWALYFLLITLAMPLILKKWPWPLPLPEYLIKRTLGLMAFLYASLHFGLYLFFDLERHLNALLMDIQDRPFIAIGLFAWLLLIPLALTSTQNWQKRLKKHWHKLHKTIYLITGLGILHYFLIVKIDFSQPLLLLFIFVTLIWLKAHKT